MERKRTLYFDVLNVLCCLAVIALHHNGIVHSFENTLAWKESLVVECLFYFAVPVFLMISGATLLPYRQHYSTKTYAKKRILRTVVPWLFWSLVFLFWKSQTGQLSLAGASAMDGINLVLNNKVESSYWFFGALFACYLAIPVLSLLKEQRKILWYIVLLNFLFLSCLPALKTWFGFSFSLDIPFVGSLILYPILGYLMATQEFSKPQRIGIYLAGLGGFLFRLVYTYVFSVQTGKTDVSIKGYVMFHAVFLSAAVFLWAKQVHWEKCLPAWLKKILPQMAACSFGIYLIHKMILFYELKWLHLSAAQHLWRFPMVFVTYLLGLGIVFLAKKVPGLRKIL